MKSSKYNYYVEDGGYTIIFNGFTEKLFRIPAKLESSFQNIINTPDVYVETFSEFIEKMKSDGFIIDDDFEESFIDKYNRIKNPDLYHLMILPTYECNLRCWYCTQEHSSMWLADNVYGSIKERIRQKLEDDRINRIVISWFGGEPLLSYDKIISLSGWVKQLAAKNNKSYTANMTTNGTLLTEERIKKLVDVGITHYQITIDGKKDVHDKIKVLGKLSAYETSIKNVGLISKYARCTIRLNYTAENLEPDQIIDDLDRYLPEEGRENLDFLVYKVWQESKAKIPFDKVKILMNKSMSIKILPYLPSISMCYGEQQNFECVFPNGKVGRCDNHKPLEVPGTLMPDGRIKWEDDPDYYRMVIDHTDCICNQCRYLPLCSGPCLAKRKSMLAKYGKIICQFEDPDKEIANAVRNIYLNYEFKNKYQQNQYE